MDDIIEFRGLLTFYGWERDFSGPLDYILTRNDPDRRLIQRIELSWQELKAMSYEAVVTMLKTGIKP